MEALGALCDGEWDSFAAMFSSEEQDYYSPLPNNSNATSTELQLPDNGWFYSLDAFDPNLQSDVSLSLSCSSCSTDNSSGSGNAFLFPNPWNHDNLSLSIDDERNFGSSFLSDVLMGEVNNSLAANDETAACDGLQIPPPPPPADFAVSLKRKVNTRISGHGQKRKMIQKAVKGASVEDIGGNAAAAAEGQSSMNYSSEEENGGGGATTSDGGVSGKVTRASRGSATDPQSLYARKRRERINERLKILQKLVPNGTKVDISTMLEEAVHYVKFLQLQIKLLSSDEMWMFAPLAYNGMDLGLHQKLSPFLSH